MTLHTAYLFSYLLPDDPARYDLRNWLGAAPVMAALSKSLYGVASGYAFNWPLAARVLWPPPPAHPFVNHERLVARHSVKQIENAFRGSKQGRVVSQVRRHSGTLTRLLSRYYPRQENERAAGEVTRLIRTSQEYNPTHDDLNTLNDVLLSLESIEITRTRATDAAIRVGLERSQASINNHSIVFDLGDRALFLSDLDGGSMNRMAQEYMSGRQSYDFLKSAHHGTQLGVDSFLDRVPQCDLVLHCCGSAHPQYNPPTDAYCLLDPRKIVCTDRHPRLTQLRSGYRYEFFDSRKKVFRL
jgi:hypothetical protein